MEFKAKLDWNPEKLFKGLSELEDETLLRVEEGTLRIGTVSKLNTQAYEATLCSAEGEFSGGVRASELAKFVKGARTVEFSESKGQLVIKTDKRLVKLSTFEDVRPPHVIKDFGGNATCTLLVKELSEFLDAASTFGFDVVLKAAEGQLVAAVVEDRGRIEEGLGECTGDGSAKYPLKQLKQLTVFGDGDLMFGEHYPLKFVPKGSWHDLWIVIAPIIERD